MDDETNKLLKNIDDKLWFLQLLGVIAVVVLGVALFR